MILNIIGRLPFWAVRFGVRLPFFIVSWVKSELQQPTDLNPVPLGVEVSPKRPILIKIMINIILNKAKPRKSKRKNKSKQSSQISTNWGSRSDTASEESFWIAKHIYGYDGSV